MLKILAITMVVVLAMGAEPAQASLPFSSSIKELSLRERVQNSDLIAVGFYETNVNDTLASLPAGGGWLHIQEVLWGDQVNFLLGKDMFTERVRLEWAPAPEPCRPARQHIAGAARIWFLQRRSQFVYLASEDSYVGLEQRGKIEGYLRKDWVVMRVHPGELHARTALDLIVRNAHARDALVPEFRYANGVLYLHPRVQLTVRYRPAGRLFGGVDIPPLAGKVLPLDKDANMVVQSGEEYLAPIDLEEIFPLEPQRRYEVRFRIKGYGRSSLRFDLP